MSQTATPSLPEKIVRYVGLTSAALEKAAAAERTKEAQDAKIAALIPRVADLLVEHERIEPGQKAAAMDVLKDPVQVLDLLGKVAAHRVPSERRLGTPANSGAEKRAEARVLGARRAESSEADARFFAALGLQPPTA